MARASTNVAAPSLSAILVASAALAEPPIVVVDRDNVEITGDCRIQVAGDPIPDDDGNGVIHVTADGATVFFESPLRGAADGQAPNTYQGVGLRITARHVTIRGAAISGYKTGIYATRSDHLVVEDADLSDNFRQRLHSGPRGEDPADWLRPHANDANEWMDLYGAALWVERAAGVTIRRVRARGTQNGIVLDNVSESAVYDNDCSFGSGWGIAMWRSSNNTIARNACDFRIRGYQHGVYNRGQDSAGILMFEQCSRNTITHNSATHCGDGFFGFAGAEALGEANPRADLGWYAGRGCNRNLIASNDFSYAAAHGLELTFSFRNRVVNNRLVGNAICGAWCGYSQDTYIGENVIEANGEMPYGQERGGVNIEHSVNNHIYGNQFRNNPCGVFLWWDRDERIQALPWGQINTTATEGNLIIANSFDRDRIAIQIRRSGPLTLAANDMTDVEVEVDADALSETVITRLGDMDLAESSLELPEAPGQTNPVGARTHLRGRRNIVMTEWGPYDWTHPLLMLRESGPARHVYEVLGPEALADASLAAPGPVTLTRDGSRLIVETDASGLVLPYTLTASTEASVLSVPGTLMPTAWRVIVFASEADPREDAEAWRAAGEKNGVECELPALDLIYGRGGPSDLGLSDQIGRAGLPADNFGTIASTTIELPAGSWRVTTSSDDGIRVWLDEALVIDDWKWHPPKAHTYELELAEPKSVAIRVEHFELDGHAELLLDIEPVD